MGGGNDRGGSTALLRPKYRVLPAVPSRHGIAVILHVIQFAVIPDGSFGKMHVRVQDLDIAGMSFEHHAGDKEGAE